MSLDWLQSKPRKRILPTDKVPLKLTDRQRELVIEHTFAPEYLMGRMRPGPQVVGAKPQPVAFTLDEWEELHGYVAAEANHCDERKLERELYRICDRVQDILDTHTDQD